jgi:hypothetical protein
VVGRELRCCRLDYDHIEHTRRPERCPTIYCLDATLVNAFVAGWCARRFNPREDRLKLVVLGLAKAALMRDGTAILRNMTWIDSDEAKQAKPKSPPRFAGYGICRRS